MVVHPVEKCWIKCPLPPFSGEVKRWYPSWLSRPWAVSQPQRRQRSPPETLPRRSTQHRTAFQVALAHVASWTHAHQVLTQHLSAYTQNGGAGAAGTVGLEGVR